MTKSADQEQASPSSSFPAYVFEGPAQVAIRTRTNDQPRYVDTRLSVWTWYDGGKAMKIDWAALHLNPQLMHIAESVRGLYTGKVCTGNGIQKHPGYSGD